jgi:hypothetical protein
MRQQSWISSSNANRNNKHGSNKTLVFDLTEDDTYPRLVFSVESFSTQRHGGKPKVVRV